MGGIHKISEEDNKKFMELIKEGTSIGHMRTYLKLGYLQLILLYKKHGMTPPSMIKMVIELEEKVYALEEQIKLVFEKLGI